jgi:hypothetical protein
VFEEWAELRWLCVLISPLSIVVQYSLSKHHADLSLCHQPSNCCTSLQWTLSSQTMAPRAEGEAAVKALPLTHKPSAGRKTMLQPSFVKTTSEMEERSRATRCILLENPSGTVRQTSQTETTARFAPAINDSAGTIRNSYAMKDFILQISSLSPSPSNFPHRTSKRKDDPLNLRPRHRLLARGSQLREQRFHHPAHQRQCLDPRSDCDTRATQDPIPCNGRHRLVECDHDGRLQWRFSSGGYEQLSSVCLLSRST